MGNMVPCLVVQSSSATTMPAMEPGKRMFSLRIVMKVLHRMKKIRGNYVAGSSPSEAGGGVDGVKQSMKARFARPSPRRAAACHGRRGGGVGGGQRKGVVTMKVVLTKEEAARLLSLTAGGKKATAAQIVAEMRRMEARRAAATTAWRPALASIPEESW